MTKAFIILLNELCKFDVFHFILRCFTVQLKKAGSKWEILLKGNAERASYRYSGSVMPEGVEFPFPSLLFHEGRTYGQPASIMFLLAWYSTSTTLFSAILSPAFLNDSITFFGTIGKGIVSLLQEIVTGADSFGQLSNGISNSIISEILYWLIAAIIMGILFLITGFLIIGIGYQVGKIYRKYCWDIISIMMAIMSTAIVIYFGEWIKSVIPINLIVLLLLVHVVYIGI